MKVRISYIALLLLVLCSLRLPGQTDLDPPVAPVLDLVSVDQSTGNVEISWSPSPSPDVIGYVVYIYKDNEGFEPDTIYGPSATNVLRIGSGSVYYSESFIVKALDTAGNVSLQSNVLSTIYVSVQIDTCNKRVEIAWNSYSSVPKEVMDYRVYYSVNGGSTTDSIMTGPGTTNLVLEDFIVDAQYCFFVKASLTGGLRSGSNKACLLTKMQRPPEWINADYASVVNNHDIMLSFTPDPMSEIRSYVLEKKTGINGQFTQIYSFENISGRTQFIDDNADVSKVNFYRFNAINSCNKMVTLSNLASNIVLALNQDDEEINLSWNPYKTWRGLIDSNLVYIKTGQELEERYSLAPTDSAMVIEYSSLMYEVTQPEICFMIRAVEASNPYYANGETSSQVVCIPVTEKVTVPNMFTPDNNSVNDLFRPILSFTPLNYKLLITDIKRKAIFETTDFQESWDGSKGGVPQPEGVYLWFLNIRTPAGREIVRTGTVTIVHNP